MWDKGEAFTKASTGKCKAIRLFGSESVKTIQRA